MDVEHGGVDLQRRGGGADGGDAGPGGEALEVAGQRLTEADDGRDLCRAVDEGDVLARLGEQGEVLGELTPLERHVAGADLGRHDVQLRRFVQQGRALAQILEGAGAALPGAEVERLGDAPAGREAERPAFVQEDIVVLGQSGHQDRPRRLRERPLHQLARQTGDTGGDVDLRAVRRELMQEGRAGETHARAGEQVQGAIDDQVLLSAAQPRRVCLHPEALLP